jgi:hypothetical protein
MFKKKKRSVSDVVVEMDAAILELRVIAALQDANIEECLEEINELENEIEVCAEESSRAHRIANKLTD